MSRFLQDKESEMEFDAESSAFAVIREWIGDAGSEIHAPEEDIHQLIVAADEIFSNIVLYAYAPESKQKKVHVTLIFDPDRNFFGMTFRDHGIAFNPLGTPAKLPVERIQNRIPGGIGLFLVTEFMDQLEYRRDKECNVLTLGKILHSPHPAPAVEKGSRRAGMI